jgi:tetratricopeptide (TPR) repeat protein
VTHWRAASDLLLFARRLAPMEELIARPLFIIHLRLGREKQAIALMKEVPLERVRDRSSMRLLRELRNADAVLRAYKAVLDSGDIPKERRQAILKEAIGFSLRKRRNIIALPWIEEVVKGGTDDPELIQRACDLFISVRRYRKGIDLCENYLARAESLAGVQERAILKKLVILYVSSDSLQEGTKFLSRMQKRYPEVNAIVEWRIYLLHTAGEKKQAIEVAAAHYKRLIAKAPKDVAAYLALSDLRWDAGKRKEALAILDGYLQKTKVGVGARRARGQLAEMHHLAGSKKTAFALLRLNLRQAPGDIQYSNNLGYMLSEDDEHLDEALKLVKVATAVEPDSAAYLDSLGWVLYRLAIRDNDVANLSKSRKALDRAILFAPRDPVLRDHLGDVLSVLGDWEAAVKSWRTATTVAGEEREKALPNYASVQRKLKAATEALEKNIHPGGPIRPLKPPPESAQP